MVVEWENETKETEENEGNFFFPNGLFVRVDERT